jgi:hypothetical protein
MGTGYFQVVKCGQGVLLTTHPLLASRSWKSTAIPLPPPGYNPACNGVTLSLLNHKKHIAKTFNQYAPVGLLCKSKYYFNPLNAELNPICHLLALLEAHHILHVSRISVNTQIWKILTIKLVLNLQSTSVEMI